MIVDKAARTALHGHRPAVVWFTGLSGTGKSTIANLVEKQLHALGRQNRQPEGGAADEAQCQADAVDGGVGPSLGRGVSRKFGHRRSGSTAVTTRTGKSGHTAGRWTIGCVSNSASGAKGVLHH